ncbi:DNA repair protein RadA [Natronoglycomyces albus]|uniref:DNA repair protein RadA n=1 Tax=Natronoglycomyces albus TaxID=2811108 RepID=A0A895XPH9_9ACTN|nr:DNA repair protein RadA [Natronoglycomyces albus]QSB05279.1 DNA repair protein RadA [Natronoglycomyces albus]
MAKAPRTQYACTICGHRVPKWFGQCPDCGEWGSMEETAPEVRKSHRAAASASVARPATPAQSIGDVSSEKAAFLPIGIGEFDRVMGGGVVPGGVTLIAGEPGVGKSTLLLDVAHRFAARGFGKALVATGEESASQVRRRADRTDCLHPDLFLAAETDLAAVLGHLDDVKPGLLILDSVQTVTTGDNDGVPGGVTQVRAVASAVISVAKARGIAVILVGHVTKDGNIAGPRVLEHLVDTVVNFEGDRHSMLRLLRGVKNRFGPADEVGCFEMREDGITSIADPTGLFLAEQPEEPTPGTCVTVAMEGRRALLVEVQALAGRSVADGAVPRHTVSGLELARLNMVLAVLQRYAKVKVLDKEIYATTVGGMKVKEPAADLAIALAITSVEQNLAISSDLVAIGEVSLTGAIRRCANVDRRLAEAARLGFKTMLVPPGCTEGTPAGCEVVEVANVEEAKRAASRAWAQRNLEAYAKVRVQGRRRRSLRR